MVGTERKRYVVVVPDCGVDGCEDEGDWRGFYESKKAAEDIARYMIEEGDPKVYVAEIRKTFLEREAKKWQST